MVASGRSRVVLSTVIASLALAASAPAAGPPPPTAAGGQAVQVVATGVPTPTAFAFTGSTVFAGSGPDESGKAKGGLFVLAGGKATRLADSPPAVFGLAWRAGTLYVSAGTKLLAYRGWNGTAFSGVKTIYTGKKGFAGFNGLAFGPDGRLYSGLSLDEKYDHTQNPNPLSQSVVSMTAAGKDLRVVAKGLRQPFQLVFPAGAHHPYVTVLQQDKGKVPADEIVVAKTGQDYGFPKCNPSMATDCKAYARPLVLLPKHASPMGIAAIGKTLYVALFSGSGKGPEVVTVPTSGGTPKPFLTGFVAPVIGLGIDRGTVYVGDLTGTIYKVTP
jgi:glucose/arabinose dehydrogenase